MNAMVSTAITGIVIMLLFTHHTDVATCSEHGKLQEREHTRIARNVLNSMKCDRSAGLASVFEITISAACKSKRTREVTLQITWNSRIDMEDKIHHYWLSLINGGKKQQCFDNIYKKRFDIDHNTSLIYNITVLAISKNGTVIGGGWVTSRPCPDKLRINVTPKHLEKEIGSNHTIQCEYTGSPEPKLDEGQLYWQFTRDRRNCKMLSYLDGLPRVHISKDKKVVEIVDINEENDGCYVCNVRNDFVSVYQKSYLRVIPRKRIVKSFIGPIIGGVAGGLLFVVILIMIYKYCLKPKPGVPLVSGIPDAKTSVYISHCATTDKSRANLLKLADLLQREFSIEVILDLTSNIPINRAGGMCRWVPTEIDRAKKIMIVLSKEYLEALKAIDKKQSNHIDQNNEMLQKVHSEFGAVKTEIYHKCNRTRRIVVVSDRNVKVEDIPEPICGRSMYSFPQYAVADNMDVLRIVGVLYDEELIQLST